MSRKPFKLRRDGSIEARLGETEARMIRRVAADLAEAVLRTDDPSTHRLFPPAYEDDPRLQQEFEQLTRDELLAGKIAAAETVTGSIDAGSFRRGDWHGALDEPTAGSWLRILNDARLVLGTRLDVSEEMELPDDDDPAAPAMNLYLWLGWIEEMLVDALAAALPDQTDPVR